MPMRSDSSWFVSRPSACRLERIFSSTGSNVVIGNIYLKIALSGSNLPNIIAGWQYQIRLFRVDRLGCAHRNLRSFPCSPIFVSP